MDKSLLTAIKCKTLEKVWFGIPADYTRLIIFGCLAYADVNKSKNLNLELKSVFSWVMDLG